jgi:hypothetical protein
MRSCAGSSEALKKLTAAFVIFAEKVTRMVCTRITKTARLNFKPEFQTACELELYLGNQITWFLEDSELK